MKIAYVINNMWYSGGQTRVIANKLNYWAEEGHDVYLLTADQFDHGDYYRIDPRVKRVDYGIGYIGTDQMPKLKKAFRIIQMLMKHRRLMKQTLEEIKPDVVVSMYDRTIYFIPFLKDPSVKVVEAHGGRYTWIYSRPGFFGRLLNKIELFFLRRFDRLVVLTKEDVSKWDVERISYVHNANTFYPEDPSPLTEKVVVAVGRHGEQKNFENLVEAWAIVHKQHPDWKLKICGQGLENLDALIEHLGLKGSIICRLSWDMVKEYQESSICALSSRHEGMPMCLLEAQATGLPIVSYACECGPRDIIEDGKTGLLIEELQDKTKLAEGIIKLIEDEPLRRSMGAAARERAKLFSPEAIMTRWKELFIELIEEKRNRLNK